MISKIGAKTSESGQANLFFLIGLTLSLIALMILFIRLGSANELRTDSQTAADAAAMAAAGIARDNMAQRLSNDELPYSRVYDNAEGRRAAEYYAAKNGATLTDIRASDDSTGNLGNIVRVEVQSTNCQNELKEDRSRDWADIRCENGDPESEHVGNAAAIATAVAPECEYAFSMENSEIIGIRCDGELIQSFRHAQRLVEVHLTDEEGQYIYKPVDSAA